MNQPSTQHPSDLRPPGAHGTQSLARALQLLRLIASQNRLGVRLKQAVESSGMSKTTVFRLLRELCASGLVRQSEGKRYHLGQFAFELGLVAGSDFNARDLCSPSMRSIAQETGDTVLLITQSGTDSIFLDYKAGGFPTKMVPVEIGYRQPLGVGPGGLAYLSFLPESERSAIALANAPRLGAYPGMNLKRLFTLIDQTLMSGYAILENFHTPGVVGIGVPVLDRAGRPAVSISVSAAKQRMTPSHKDSVLRVLRREANEMRKALFGSSYGES